MKKLILTAAAAMMVLASCTKTTVESIDGPKEIAFKKIEGAMTKAPTELTGTMGVFAYLNGITPTTQYFGNTEFSKGATYWEGGKYWPLNGQALDFVVYAPHIAGATFNHGTKTLSYTVTDNSTAQKDYLYGAEFYDNFNKNSSPIPVKLKHALAQITVKITANTPNVFTVTSLTLNNTYQAGTINVKYDDTPVCTPANPSTQHSHNFVNSATPIGATPTTAGSYLVFPSDQTSFTLVYSMEEATGLVVPINLGNTEWKSGKHYVYNITLTADEILFTPTVEEWATSPGENYVESTPEVN
jgi:hypothetical protein